MKIANIILCLFLAGLFNPVAVDAFEFDSTPFQSIKQVGIIEEVVVPTVVGLPIEGPIFSGDEFVVIEETGEEDKRVIASRLFSSTTAVQIKPTFVNSTPSVPSIGMLSDNRLETDVDFLLPESGEGEVSVTFTYPEEITSSDLVLRLAQHVAQPQTVAVYAEVDGNERVVVAPRRLSGLRLSFPETTSTKWRIEFTYSQPLRIAELQIRNSDPETMTAHELRFLAQPERSYEVYFNADRQVRVATSEMGDLSSDSDVLPLNSYPTIVNQAYRPADVDNDGVADTVDNCVRQVNPDQVDVNGNGRGDVCDDFDRDGIMNPVDNCPNEPNRNQADEDGDGIGDVCDDAESRLTEQFWWLPWVGMGLASVVIAVLFVLILRQSKQRKELEQEITDDEII